jgi:hypothetical protein
MSSVGNHSNEAGLDTSSFINGVSCDVSHHASPGLSQGYLAKTVQSRDRSGVGGGLGVERRDRWSNRCTK